MHSNAAEPTAVTVLPPHYERAPALGWLAFGLLLAGLGTVMLGSVLPNVSNAWHLSDSASSLLIASKFIGSFVGGVSVPRKLSRGILAGTLLSAAGFCAFALSRGLITGALSLLVSGIGLGLIIATTNIVAARRWSRHGGSALAALNVFFSLGAVSCGLVAAALLPRYGVAVPVAGFAALFAVASVGGLVQSHTFRADADHRVASASTVVIARYAAYLVLYGGLETTVAVWITTFALRYTGVSQATAQSAMAALWTALVLARALSSWLMRSVSESVLQRVSPLLTAAAIVALLRIHTAGPLWMLCIVLGAALAPLFPAIFARLMQHSPSPRQAGFVLAVSGIGAAVFPALTGIVSDHTGSLRIGMIVPAVLALGIAVMSLTDRPTHNRA